MDAREISDVSGVMELQGRVACDLRLCICGFALA